MSHPLPLLVHSVLTIQPIVPHSLSMQLKLNLYVTYNTTMMFLPGDHILDRNIKVANIAWLTMHASPLDGIVTVACNGSAGFSFTNMVDISIYSLAFTLCQRSWSYSHHPASNSVLLLQSIQYAELVNCCFHDNHGIALELYNTSITAEDRKFIHNQCVCESSSESFKLGCGITTLNSNLTFTGNTSFLENSASNRNSAGAIWALASSLHFTGTNNFIGNSAWYIW